MPGKSVLTFAIGLLLVLMTACGQPPVLELGEFGPYVEKFETRSVEAGSPVQVTELAVRFGELENPKEVGLCEMGEGLTPTITIRKEAWERKSESEREALIFHELGHCVLKRKHKNEVTAEGVPLSLMNSHTIPRVLYDYNRLYYQDELFLQDQVDEAQVRGTF